MNEVIVDSITGETIVLDTLTEREPAPRCHRCGDPAEVLTGGMCWDCWEYGDTEDEA